MQLIRFKQDQQIKPGVMFNGQRKDCAKHFMDWDHAFFAKDGLRRLSQMDLSALPNVPDSAAWEPPVARPGKIICVGLNYHNHAKETGSIPPKEPLIFSKATTAMNGPYGDILIPRNSEKTDWEIELAIVMGKDARYLNDVAESADYIAGYCLANDVSERDFQKNRSGQFIKGKSCDTFFPLGPYLVTKDEIADVQNLSMQLYVNDTLMQHGNTCDMIFDVNFIVHHLSQFMTLEAGDIISTGTPSGVGAGMQPPQFLKPGDQLTLTIDGLGEQRCKVR